MTAGSAFGTSKASSMQRPSTRRPTRHSSFWTPWTRSKWRSGQSSRPSWRASAWLKIRTIGSSRSSLKLFILAVQGYLIVPEWGFETTNSINWDKYECHTSYDIPTTYNSYLSHSKFGFIFILNWQAACAQYNLAAVGRF